MSVERDWDESCSVQMAVRANVVESTALISIGKESIEPAAVTEDILPTVAEMTPGIVWKRAVSLVTCKGVATPF